MASQSWVSLVNAASPRTTGAGTSLATAATATISPCQAGALLSDVAAVNPDGQPLGWYPGLVIRVTARGFITTTSTSTTATFLLRANKGNSNSYTTLATSIGLATGTGTLTGVPWKLEALVRCTACAASGNTVATQGEMYISQNPATGQTVNTASAGVNLYMPSASGETVAAVDTTQLTGIGLAATLAGANATIACTQWLAEALD
jgi:hypothetical protein